MGWSDRGQVVSGKNFSRRTERRLAVMTPQTAADLERILEANGEEGKPQSFGDCLAQHVEADIKRLGIPVTL